MRQVYPIGHQSFERIRQDNFLYIDKTEDIFRLVTSSSYYFFSRPRRFGKSLLLSTFDAIFAGKKHLFEGLWIYDKLEFHSYPIIYISFTNISHLTQGLENGLLGFLSDIAKKNEIILSKQTYDGQFQELIIALNEKYNKKVVILIDEYDVPIIDYLGKDIEKAKANRDTLKAFYSVLKNLDSYIQFLFITGVSKCSKVSIFSDLNNLNDLTMSPLTANICGYTQWELQHYFGERIQEIAAENEISEEECKAQIKSWYNGYSWNIKDKLYNPFSILLFMQTGEFQNYWFETGTPTFLVRSMNEDFFYDVEGMEVSDQILKSYDLENLDYRAILFQTGYVTLKERLDIGYYSLTYPNREVRQSLLCFILGDYIYKFPGDSLPIAYQTRNNMRAGNLEKVMEIIHIGLFAKIPNELFRQHYENFYHAIIFVCFRLIGQLMQCEVSHSQGRIDAVCETDKYVYIFEFKVDSSAEAALEQIKEKQYFAPFLHSGKEIVLIGVNFTADKKGVEKWIVERMNA